MREELEGVYGEYGFYSDYVLPEEFLPANEDYLDEQWWYADDSSDYMVSTHGRVWSAKSQQIIKSKKLDNHGHVGIAMYVGGGKKKCLYRYTHRLMAEAFLPQPEGCNVVRHLNDDPSYNFIDNLAWGTQKDNMRDCISNGNFYYTTAEDRRKGNEPRMIPVISTNMDTGEEYWFESMQEASRKLGIPQANIWKVLNGERRQAGGYYHRRGEKRNGGGH